MPTLKVFDKNSNFVKEIPLNNKDTLLKQIINNNIPIYYGCMSGSCSACKCKILKGKEHLDKESLKKAVYKDIKEDEFLACLCKIKKDVKDDVTIEIKKVL